MSRVCQVRSIQLTGNVPVTKHLKIARGARVAPGNRSMLDTMRTFISTGAIGAGG